MTFAKPNFEKAPTKPKKLVTGKNIAKGTKLPCTGCNGNGQVLTGKTSIRDCTGCKGKGYIIA